VVEKKSTYRGRLAPSPTGLLHLGHARTFWTAHERATAARSTSSGQTGGELFLRNDDLDRARCRPEFVTAMLEDLRWFGFTWREPVITQSERLPLYRTALAQLHAAGLVYPCTCSRKDVAAATSAPHEVAPVSDRRNPAAAPPTPFDDEPLYPGTCRPKGSPLASGLSPLRPPSPGDGVNWRFRVPDGETLAFNDGHFGAQHAVAGRDFGDFLVWRKDDLPSYQLASVVDDAALVITEVVRGADLIKSTFRQLLLFRALGHAAPAFYHCPLVTDDAGVRLAKRHDALALRTLRTAGRTPAEIRATW
jgi:glutamyl-tRNA synthetase